MRRLTPAVLMLTLSAVLSGCGSTDQPSGAPTPLPTTSSTPDPSATPTETPMRPDPSDLTPITPTDQIRPTPIDGALPTGPVPEPVQEREDIQEAVKAEAERRSVDISKVEVAGYADVTWRDGSIGCPEPGMMYTMALVPGHQLILDVDGELASYHAAEGKPFSYCANPTPPLPREDR